MLFSRFGGINNVHQKNNIDAPEKRGVYCFVKGFEDRFYLTDTNKLKVRMNTFNFKGKVWVHNHIVPTRFKKEVTRNKNSWSCISVETLERIVNILKFTHKTVGKDGYKINHSFECFINLKGD